MDKKNSVVPTAIVAANVACVDFWDVAWTSKPD